MKHKIISETAMTMAGVYTVLGKVKKSEGELNFRAQKTFDHLQQLSLLSEKKAKELEKKIIELDISRMREQYIRKLIDTLPTTEKDVKLVLSQFNVTFGADDLKRIVNIVKEYVA